MVVDGNPAELQAKTIAKSKDQARAMSRARGKAEEMVPPYTEMDEKGEGDPGFKRVLIKCHHCGGRGQVAAV